MRKEPCSRCRVGKPLSPVRVVELAGPLLRCWPRWVQVAVTARTTAELDVVVAAIRGGKGTAVAVRADLAQPEAPRQVLEQVHAELGPIDILVNNAGIGSSGSPRPVAEFDDAFWDLTLWLNLTVPYRLSKGVLPHMLQQRWGRIINVASINGKMPSFHGRPIRRANMACSGSTRTLALEVAKEGVTVNAIFACCHRDE